jgi:uncharacterized protein YaeQ
MAIGASIYKVDVNVANLNTHYYEDHSLTIAKHPSENVTRLMIRLVSFLANAHGALEFTKGLSTSEEPDIWQRDYSGEIIQWIELGQPELKRVRQSCGKSQKVRIYTYHENKSNEWFLKNKESFNTLNKLEITHLKVRSEESLEDLVERNMKLNCMIEENTLYLSNDNKRVEIELMKLK